MRRTKIWYSEICKLGRIFLFKKIVYAVKYQLIYSVQFFLEECAS